MVIFEDLKFRPKHQVIYLVML